MPGTQPSGASTVRLVLVVGLVLVVLGIGQVVRFGVLREIIRDGIQIAGSTQAFAESVATGTQQAPQHIGEGLPEPG